MVSEHLLRRHVRESNLIEGVTAKSGEPHFDDHLLAARIAATGRFVHPNALHRVLMRRIDPRRGWGVYRTTDVSVDDREMPPWQEVPLLMPEWFGLVRQLVDVKREDLADAIDLLHVWILCIHPWRDGNGRTARLVLNMLRLMYGLPWHIIRARDKARYRARIRDYEDRVFRPAFAPLS